MAKYLQIFSDDFNRTNSTTVGNDWTESEPGGNSRDFNINNNRLQMRGIDSPTGARCYRTATDSRVDNIRITFTFNWDDAVGGAGHLFWVVTRSDNTYENGLGLKMVRDSSNTCDMYLMDNTTVKGSALNQSITDETDYDAELIVNGDASMEYRFWASSGSRPDAATISVAAFSADASGSNWAIFWTNVARNCRLDDFVVSREVFGAAQIF